MQYFPAKFRKGQLPRRDYFYNILNTISPGYMTKLVDHANAQRNEVGAGRFRHDYIEMSEAWYARLMQSSYVSCK
jgi:hypothetical protein